uniref:G-protein coupled receptors family 1 profile domain-containing protein n=1 Tax=Oryzias latipes TaxID=8090 RepID=A0A3P9HFF2_ORYLA
NVKQLNFYQSGTHILELCFPELLNSSCRRTKLSPSAAVLIPFTLSFVSLTTVTLNLLVIVSVSHFRRLHTPTNLLILSLAVSDFCVGFLILFQVFFLDGCWYLGDLMCVFYYVLDVVVTSSSVGNMVLISVDRYVAICYPLHYPTKVTLSRARLTVSLCWICSLLYDFVLMKENLKHPGKANLCLGECVISISSAETVADLFITVVIPITAITVLCVRVFVAAVSQIRAIRPGAAAQPQRGGGTVRKSELRAARTLGVVVLVFLMCLLPYYCVLLEGPSGFFNASYLAFFMYLFYLNSCINPLIYALFYPWFRKSVKIIVTFKVMKPGSRDIKMM